MPKLRPDFAHRFDHLLHFMRKLLHLGEVARHREEPGRFPLQEGPDVAQIALKGHAHLFIGKMSHLLPDQHHRHGPTAHQTQQQKAEQLIDRLNLT
jgi:hypothetical protein